MIYRRLLAAAVVLVLAGCAGDTHHYILVSTADQEMVVFHDHKKIATYPVSTSKFGLGDKPGSDETPLGLLCIKKKIGDNVPSGGVFKSRQFTGEILRPNAPGRDLIVTRIIWLQGLENCNCHAYSRYIYIHGTPEEWKLGQPASFGCIRMKSADILALYDAVGCGAKVRITSKPLNPKLLLPPGPPVSTSAR